MKFSDVSVLMNNPDVIKGSINGVSPAGRRNPKLNKLFSAVDDLLRMSEDPDAY